MQFETFKKDRFFVIGKEGSTRDGPGFVQRLWAGANERFQDIAHLAKRDGRGDVPGLWGVMTDFSRSFLPWENGFTQGLYLAGVECEENTQPPPGWAVWTVPAFTYMAVEQADDRTFARVIAYMQTNNIPLAGACFDFSCPKTGKDYLLFPTARL